MLRQRTYLKRLRQDLAVWVGRGWVTPTSQQEILDYVAAQRGFGVRYLPLAFSVLGVLLLGSGVITFFAANWSVMPKLVKLLILLGGMWLAYGGAGYFLEKRESPQLGEALLLLGVILFGANIMLIAQIYHIDAHYPNGVLVWALGGLLTAYLMNSQAAMIAGIALAGLWSGMETFGFARAVHWHFLILWGACLPLILRRKWLPAAHVAAIAFLSWSWFLYQRLAWWPHEWTIGGQVYLMQIYFLAYLAIFVLGSAMDRYPSQRPFAPMVQRYAAFAALMSFYALTFPDLHRGFASVMGRIGVREAVHGPWIIVTLVLIGTVVGLAVWHRAATAGSGRATYLDWGDALLGCVIALIVVNLFVLGEHAGAVALGFNLLFFAGLIWLVYAGSHDGDTFRVNLAFVFFGLGLLARYFDTFWTLMGRSYFFMGGGLLLIGGAYLLEKQRRRLTGRIRAMEGEGGRP